MATKKYILVTQYCQHANVEIAFLENLHEYGLVLMEKKDSESYINENDISKIERMLRLHKDLSINFEGLDVIDSMQKRLRQMEKKMKLLQQKLDFYE
ncbi:chaperone modulator CbpM [Aequorivita echinoideorum]|uniref:MerR HTH family regulatory protein n=1 Tax=Aequorivita echinoideorum TaxID=1549647 RepID=A0ABS5S5S2_9FLAO|nr:chaperone modulator CbpM [Aequorivita echinoideorum]MBT0608567.1 hypothetical protein [Aequorivita echinoideorum]